MADELQILTENSGGTSWVDSVPSAVSTGYAHQNTNINANRIGIDASEVSYDSGTGKIIVHPSGPIDDGGVPIKVVTEVQLTPTSGTYYLKVTAGSTALERNIELTASLGTWDRTLHGYYNSGDRVLNWALVEDGSGGYNCLRILAGQGDGVSVGGDIEATGSGTFGGDIEATGSGTFGGNVEVNTFTYR